MRPIPAAERATSDVVLLIWGAALLGFGLGGLVDAAIPRRIPDIAHPALTAALARLRASPGLMSLLGLLLLLPAVRGLGRARRCRLLSGVMLMGLGLFGSAIGLVDVLAAPLDAAPGSVALTIWSVALVAGGQCLFAQGAPALPSALRPVLVGSR